MGLRGGVDVSVRCEVVVAVSQPGLDILHGITQVKHDGGAAVSEVMEADTTKTVLVQKLLEFLGDIVRLDKCASVVNTDEVQVAGVVVVAHDVMVAHAMSALQPDLPHGAGLIMLSKAYHTYLAENVPSLAPKLVTLARAMGKSEATEPLKFVEALVELQKACGVDQLKMSDYGFTWYDIPALEKNARETMGMLFDADAFDLNTEDCIRIYQDALR